MGLRDRREQRSWAKYQMREELLSIGDDYWVEDDRGERAFRADGKAVRFRDTFVLEDASGRPVATIREKKLAVRDTMTIELGDREAKVHKRMLGIRDRYVVDFDSGDDYTVKGNITEHEYEIERDGRKVAEVSKKWFRVRDSYGVEVDPEEDPALVLAITVCVDAMSRGVG